MAWGLSALAALLNCSDVYSSASDGSSQLSLLVLGDPIHLVDTNAGKYT